MVQHGAFLVSRGQLGSDGKTAFSRRRGRSYKRDLPAFGEKVLFLQAGKRRSKLEDRWHPGLYIGIADRSDEVLVMDASGVHKARTCKRLDERARVDSGLLNSVTGLPWRPVPGDPAVEEVPISSHLEAPAIVAEAELPPVPMQQTSPHSFHIRKDRELAIYGYTTGCSGCRAARLGLGPQAHSLACRARIEGELMKSESGRQRLQEHYWGRHQDQELQKELDQELPQDQDQDHLDQRK